MAKGKYETNVAPYIDRIASWMERGASLIEVAQKLEVAKSTMSKYVALGRAGQEPYVDLANAVARACKEPDDTVEGAFFKRCTGYRYDEIKVEQRLDKDGNVRTLQTVTTKEVPPDSQAAMWWLANRQPDRWKYRPDEDAVATAADEDPANPSHGIMFLPAVAEAPPPPALKDMEEHHE